MSSPAVLSPASTTRFHNGDGVSSSPHLQHRRESSSSSWPWSHHRRSSSSFSGELNRKNSRNIITFLGDTIKVSPASIRSQVVNVIDAGDKTKVIGLEIPKHQESRFESEQFVAVCYNERHSDVVEAGTFPIVKVGHSSSGDPIVYIAVRMDDTCDPHSMAAFLYQVGRPGLSAKLVL